MKNILATITFITIFSICLSASSQTDVIPYPDTDLSYLQLSEIQRQAIAGDKLAQFQMGYINSGCPLYNLPDDECNYDNRMDWYRKSADQGFAPAQLELGMYFTHIEQKNKTKGIELLNLAAAQGLSDAMVQLAQISRDEERNIDGVYWYREAAIRGNKTAIFNLGSLYDQGIGAPENDVRAYMWWSIGSTLGDESSSSRLRDIREVLTRDQVALVQELATKCFESNYRECP